MSLTAQEYGTVLYDMHQHGAAMGHALCLTLVAPGDEDLLSQKGMAALRRQRILRLAAEAHAQGEPLCYEDLAALLLTSLATLKRDVKSIEQSGAHVPLRGRRRNAGACEG